MAYETNADFTPERDRAADSDATVPVIDVASFDSGGFAERRGVEARMHRADLKCCAGGGDWTPVPMIDDGFVINIGDLLMRWTNYRWVSTIHRVVNPPEAACREVDRMSVAFFFTPNHDVEVSCLESCMDAQHPARYATVTAGGVSEI